MNVEIKKLEKNLVALVNASNIPTEVKRLVVLELLMKLEAQVEKDISMELQEAKKAKENEE